MRILGLLAALIAVAPAISRAEDHVQWDPHNRPPGQPYFNQTHDESFAHAALEELSGQRPPADCSRETLAQAVLAELDKLPVYGLKSTPSIKPPIPEWFLQGYRAFQPTSVARSRYLDGVVSGTLPADADHAALYAFWCVYDAEWFSLSRKAPYKAWLSAVMLTYPPAWQRLRGESEDSLHSRLVAPLQTKDEPYREIDNWIKAFTREGDAFAKPKVRDALVDELLANAGLETDPRFFAEKAYSGPTPDSLQLSRRQFYLLAALTLEYYQEIYNAAPETKQPLYFRDYFLGVFNTLK
jgi:hypothetical protein